MYQLQMRLYETRNKITIGCDYEREDGKGKEILASHLEHWTLSTDYPALTHEDILRYFDAALSRIAQKLDYPLF